MSSSFSNTADWSTAVQITRPPDRVSEDAFLAWVVANNVKAEWVDDEVVLMSPASREHSQLRLWLLRLLSDFVETNDLGTVLDDMLVRVQPRRRYRIPDLFFVTKARENIIGETMLREPPDVVFEIVSADSAARDWREKYQEYEEFGIREYWVIDPRQEAFDVYGLNQSGKYERLLVEQGIVRSRAIPRFWIRPEWFAIATRPTVQDALRQLKTT